jgi:hypothetical protein
MTDAEALELVKLAFPRPGTPVPHTPPQPWTDLRHWAARFGADSAEIVDWIAAAGGHVGASPDKWRIPRAYLPTRLRSEPEALEWLLACVLGTGFTVWQVDDAMPWPRP